MYKLVTEEIEVDIGEREVIVVLNNGEEYTLTFEGYARSYKAPVEIPDRPIPQSALADWYRYPGELKVHPHHIKDRNILELVYSGDKDFIAINDDRTAFANRKMVAKIKAGEVFEKKIKVNQCKVVKDEQV